VDQHQYVKQDGDSESAGVVEMQEVFVSPEQLNTHLITLANLPGSRWLNLLSLDTIKAKNKPLAPPKKPKTAPFFLPTVPGLEHKFDMSGLKTAEESTSKSVNVGFTNLTEFGIALGQAETNEKLFQMVELFMLKGPSAIDLEIRSLSPEGGGSVSLMCQFIDMLKVGIESNKHFEAVQAYLGLFLKVHGDVVSCEKELTESLAKITELQAANWHSLQEDLDNCLCLVSFLKSSTL
jgi:U3 small nucleolar RNA-associated protein 21